MIDYVTGNLLEDDAEALVNTVNCEGFMGKGIALAFKTAFPENFKLYRAACDSRTLKPGRVFATETGLMFGPRQIVNVATKNRWRDPSKLEWITSGARDILRHCEAAGLRSVAVPALGCSNGGLAWKTVRPLLESVFDESVVTFRLYSPI